MQKLLSDYERAANAVSSRVSQVLAKSTAVLDPTGLVVASDQPLLVDERLDVKACRRLKIELKVPVEIAGSAAELVVIGDDGEPVSERMLKELADVLAAQVAVECLPNHRELRSRFIMDILRGEVGDEVDVLREAEILGLDLSRPRAVLLIEASDYILQPGAADSEGAPNAFVPRRAEHIINSVAAYFDATPDAICASYIGGGEIVALKPRSVRKGKRRDDDAGDDFEPGNPHSWPNVAALKVAAQGLLDRLQHETRADISIGIGRFHPGVRGIAGSYQDACAALVIGSQLELDGGIHCLDSLGTAAFVGIGDKETKHDLAGLILDGLTSAPDLIHTLERFFANDCSPSKTAADVCIHRNTLTYRLDKVATLTGLDARRFEDAVQLRVALLTMTLSDSGPKMPNVVRTHGGPVAECMQAVS